jgi:hypothetical protein
MMSLPFWVGGAGATFVAQGSIRRYDFPTRWLGLGLMAAAILFAARPAFADQYKCPIQKFLKRSNTLRFAC